MSSNDLAGRGGGAEDFTSIPSRSLLGARILLVGASGGIGRPLAAALAGRGARLVVAGRDTGRFGALGVGEVTALPSDLADDAAAPRLVAAAGETLGGLDGVVCCAGAVAFGPLSRGVSVIDARPPHKETGLASHGLHGEPPKMRAGLDPTAVAERLVLAIEHDVRDVPASAFGQRRD
jgi:NAD(P)-dependent dehydrogenase (short-subunit alcohol dehydrogenase family)